VASVAEVRSAELGWGPLVPYIPRLVVDWLRETPDAAYREVDGSLAFVDISGFTQLTERLARKGKVGAEEVNDTLDACFTELLSVAYDQGAGVVKWGGDAVLLLFDGEQHAARACCAAAGMQRTIRQIGRLRTSAGLVTLRMSVGIHSGSFHFFLVGDVHRELVLAGAAATQTVAMEALADAGQVALSAATASAIDSGLLGRLKGDGILLRRDPRIAIDRAGPVSDVDGLDLVSCMPAGLREHLLQGGEAEHRWVTSAFVELGGADQLLLDGGPDAAARALDEAVGAVQRAALEHQVTFFDSDVGLGGVKILLIAGAPTSTGNDEERMLRALRDIADTPLELRVRIGVNAGRVFAGDFGPPYRRTYSVKGDSVNLAARLMAKAEPGQVLATDAVLARSRALFQSEPLAPFRVKGKAQPVTALAVGSLAGAREAERKASPLVGRDRELELLERALESARGWEGRLVELVGEPGMGKSRLLEELRARAEGVLAVAAACEEYEVSTPYFPFRHLLRSLLGLADGDPATLARRLRRQLADIAAHLLPWAPLLAAAMDLELPETPETASLEDQFRRERLEEAARELLGIVLSTPTLLVLEDVHWLDDASCDLLRALLEGLDTRPWLVVVTRREADGGFAAPVSELVETVRLEPLAEGDAAALAAQATDDAPLPPHVLTALAERSGGNPLFLAELLEAARSGGLETMPDTLEALLTAQIDRLAPRDRTVLRCAAVLGTSFSRELLEAVLAEDAGAADGEFWSRVGGLVLPDGRDGLRFRHALVRDAAYEGLPYRRRRELHERVGQTIERRAGRRAEDEAELLSLHFFHAQRFDKAWRYSRVAGERAAAIYANVEAVALLERALDAARHAGGAADEIGRVWEALGDAALRLSEFPRAAKAYRAARRSTRRTAADDARLIQKEAMVPFRAGRYSQALRRLNHGWRLLEGVEGSEAAAQRARLFGWCGSVRQYQHRAHEAIRWCHRAIAEAERAGAKDALAHAYYILDWAYFSLGRLEDAVYSQHSIAIYEELGNLDRLAWVFNNLGGLALLDSRWNDTLEWAERARQTFERIGDRASAATAEFNLGEVLADQGRNEEAEPFLRNALRVWRATGNVPDIAIGASLLGRQAARAGRFDEAEALLAEAHALYEAEADDVELLTADTWRAESLVLQGESGPALVLIGTLLDRAERIEGVTVAVAMLHRLRGWALLQLKQLDDARRAFGESLRVARIRDANFGIRSEDYQAGVTLDALVQLARLAGEAADELERERDAIFERLGVIAVTRPPLAAARFAEALA
jgi:class 3 adenylate cyclase/tetratricopeptide (TPR) repeat protein